MEEPSPLISQIKTAEVESKSLEIEPAERIELLNKVNDYTEQFLTTLRSQKSYFKNGYPRQAIDDLFEIDGEQQHLNSLLDLVKKRVDEVGLNPPSGGHFGYIPAGGLYLSALGDYMAAITNRYAGVFYASPGAVRMENVLIRWTGKLIGYQENFGGNITSGGSYANLIAIATAKSACGIKNKDVTKAVIYVSRQSHHSILKALKITGLDECVFRIIETDEHYRMNMDLLKKQIKSDIDEGLRPFLLIANAGSTDVGAVDPLEEMAAIAKQYSIWFHVDAAYGGFFLITDYGKKMMKGIELSDSVIMDPHKGLFIPYGSGIVMVKNVKHLYEANNFDANYMQDAISDDYEFSPSQLSPELSKHFRGLRMWLPLKMHGTKPFAASLNEKLLLTRYFHEEVRKLGYKTGPYPDLSIVIFWYEPGSGDTNEFNKNILHHIQAEGSIFISSTMINGKFLLRFACLSFRTHLEQVQLLLKQLKAIEKK